MVKKIALIVLGIVLLGGIGFALWWVNEREREVDIPKESFIPYNSAVVINVNANADLLPKVATAFDREIKAFRKSMLSRVVDTLKQASQVDTSSYVMAIRVEGKQSIRFLYVLNRSGLFSRGDVHAFLQKMFAGVQVKERKYNNQKIYLASRGKDEVCYAVVGGMVLVSNSELYVEDAVNQLSNPNEDEKDGAPRFKNVNRYFSAGAGLNVFLNTTCFSDLLPLLLQKDFIAKQTNIAKWFKWGALDGEIKPSGVSFNGFVHYDGLKAAFPVAFKGQLPQDSKLDAVMPADVKSVSILALSDVKNYLASLETYRYGAGQIENVRKRKQEFARLFGDKLDEEWQALLKGEWGKGTLSYDASRKQEEGIVVVHVKAGSLARGLLEKMLKSYASKSGISETSLYRSFALDKDKKVSYFKMPVPDFAGVMWGYVLGGIATNYVLVEDNYVVFSSSERGLQVFASDYMRRLSVRDQEWYQKLRTKLSSKSNWMYLSEIVAMLPYYEQVTKGALRELLERNKEGMEVFSSLGLQWVCEGDMLYHTLFLSTEEVEQKQAQIMWQTRLDARMSMKPAIVVNHNTGERELFVQDEGNTIYLINDVGRILWKLPIDGKINSEVYQVDMFKNGKLQYLFSTPGHLYLIDRNGNYLPRFPLAFKSPCERGISVADYENNKNYRVFAPGADHHVYLYEVSGNFVKGWDVPKSDNDIVSKIYHFRVEGKDYLVYADRYRLYILDRKGKERVKVSTLLNLSANTSLYLTKQNGQMKMAFMDANGEIVLVNFRGQVERIRGEEMIGGGMFNVEDVNNDGQDEFIYTLKNRIVVMDNKGKLLFEKHWEDSELDFPYIYRFSARDSRIGIMDGKGERLFLLDMKEVSKGFPIRGNSPFSIAFGDNGSAGFYLFAGSDGTHLLKYRVLR
ncbi:WD40 repeat domain-containing protein [Butyricimonas virosa]|uniref:WD40 repeat domain-containing protein n=1 Tax=Butyricimonas virosa TaxID=544645 RepID=A0A412WXV7_9BACT|nr:WD40 repeat domain-containing protein [Butyricimonas virosa]RGV32481.1 WD40 repeat domain-containing protein [Butyricimonas virosa]